MEWRKYDRKLQNINFKKTNVEWYMKRFCTGNVYNREENKQTDSR